MSSELKKKKKKVSAGNYKKLYLNLNETRTTDSLYIYYASCILCSRINFFFFCSIFWSFSSSAIITGACRPPISILSFPLSFATSSVFRNFLYSVCPRLLLFVRLILLIHKRDESKYTFVSYFFKVPYILNFIIHTRVFQFVRCFSFAPYSSLPQNLPLTNTCSFLSSDLSSRSMCRILLL